MDQNPNKELFIKDLPFSGGAAPVQLPGAAGPGVRVRGYSLEAVDTGHPQRLAIEAFVQDRFRAMHGAEVRQFLPVLLALRGPDGSLVGVAGYRNAASGPLFLEHYLDAPIEQVLIAQAGLQPRREEIAEIGNFACSSCRASKVLVECLMEFLDARGHLWAAFTGTRLIRQIMQHMGIDLKELAPARRTRLRNSVDDWGRYYECDPRVVAGLVPARLPARAPQSARR